MRNHVWRLAVPLATLAVGIAVGWVVSQATHDGSGVVPAAQADEPAGENVDAGQDKKVKRHRQQHPGQCADIESESRHEGEDKGHSMVEIVPGQNRKPETKEKRNKEEETTQDKKNRKPMAGRKSSCAFEPSRVPRLCGIHGFHRMMSP